MCVFMLLFIAHGLLIWLLIVRFLFYKYIWYVYLLYLVSF